MTPSRAMVFLARGTTQLFVFFSSRRRHTRYWRDWSSECALPISDYAMSTGREVLKAGAPTGKSVGVVGSGPAGLSCATYLARLGYDVTVYERKALPGGLDTYGMAEYKMTQRVSTEEARQVERLGVKFRLETEVGRDVSVEELESKHDGVFLGVGLGETGRLNIPGEELEGVYDALYVIERIKSRRWETVPLGRTVAVIGAGNTAIDAVTQEIGRAHV